MKGLHLFAWVAHTLIASTHVHECCLPGKQDPHTLLLTAAYVVLALVQTVLFILFWRRPPHGPNDDHPPLH